MRARPITLASLMAAYQAKPDLRGRIDSARLRALLRALFSDVATTARRKPNL